MIQQQLISDLPEGRGDVSLQNFANSIVNTQHIEEKRIILYVFANSKINRTKIEHKVEFLKATIILAWPWFVLCGPDCV